MKLIIIPSCGITDKATLLVQQSRREVQNDPLDTHSAEFLPRELIPPEYLTGQAQTRKSRIAGRVHEGRGRGLAHGPQVDDAVGQIIEIDALPTHRSPSDSLTTLAVRAIRQMSVAESEVQDLGVTATDVLAYDEGQAVQFLKGIEGDGIFDISGLAGVRSLSESQRNDLAQILR